MATLSLLTHSAIGFFYGATFEGEPSEITKPILSDEPLSDDLIRCVYQVLSGAASFAYPESKGAFLWCKLKEREISLYKTDYNTDDFSDEVKSNFLETIENSIEPFLTYLREGFGENTKDQHPYLINLESHFYSAFARTQGLDVKAATEIGLDGRKITVLKGDQSDIGLLLTRIF
jgi:hypothetical protein